MRFFISFLGRTRRANYSRKGQTLVEYSLILCILTIVSVGVFGQLGNVIVTVFSSINAVLDTATVSH